MPLIIDTYNVLHTTGILPPEMAGIDVGGLIQLISASRYRSQLVTLVCDGTGPMPSSAGLGKLIAVRFSGPNREADDLILELVKTATDRRRITVVTSDRAVAKAARAKRCDTLSSPAFLEHLLADAGSKPRSRPDRPTGPLDEQGVDHWIKEFGLDETQVPEPQQPANPGTIPQVDDNSPIPPDVIHQAEKLLDRDSDDPPQANPD